MTHLTLHTVKSDRPKSNLRVRPFGNKLQKQPWKLVKFINGTQLKQKMLLYVRRLTIHCQVMTVWHPFLTLLGCWRKHYWTDKYSVILQWKKWYKDGLGCLEGSKWKKRGF